MAEKDEDAKIRFLANDFNALANFQRLKLLVLADGTRSVGQLAEMVGLHESAVSQHLAKLRSAGLVTVRREAQTNYHQIDRGEVAELFEQAVTVLGL